MQQCADLQTRTQPLPFNPIQTFVERIDEFQDRTEALAPVRSFEPFTCANTILIISALSFQINEHSCGRAEYHLVLISTLISAQFAVNCL